MKLLYLEDAYLKEFEAEVERVEGGIVLLSQTAFYPTGGGQPCDKGKLIRLSDGKEFEVVEVKKQGSVVIHVLNKEGLCDGDKVKGAIDWERRYRLMRMHTAAHVLSATVNKLKGALVTGKQLDIDKSRIDFSVEQFDREALQGFAEEANMAISTAANVKTYFLEREEAMKIPGVVKLAERMPPALRELRIVEIQGIDVQACGGTHVKNLSELGKIKLLKVENKGKTNRRIYYTLE